MAEYIRFSLADGGHILVESASGEGVQLTSRAARAVDAASESFGEALSSVRKAAGEALKEFRLMADGPAEIEIEFGVILRAEAGAVIAKTGVEGHLKVTLTWRPAQPDGLRAEEAGPDDEISPGRDGD